MDAVALGLTYTAIFLLFFFLQMASGKLHTRKAWRCPARWFVSPQKRGAPAR